MKPTKPTKETMKKAIKYLVAAIATSIAIAFGLTSCQMTRTITTTSQAITKGDTSTVIQVKTIENVTLKQDLKK